jgi:hypothetical protein
LALQQDFQKLPEATKRGFDTFHNRATFRGLRYDLLLAQIYKNAPEDDPDRDYVHEAMSVIKQQALDSNEGIAATKSKVALRDYHGDLIPKSGDTLQDLELLDESRRFFTAGKVYRRPDGTGFTDWTEAHLILFDHYRASRCAALGQSFFVANPLAPFASRHDQTTARARWPTKVSHQSSSAVWPHLRPPQCSHALPLQAVPLDLIHLKATSFSEPPLTRSSGFHLRSTTSRQPSNSSPLAQDASSLV